jgi:hypothetical protein
MTRSLPHYHTIEQNLLMGFAGCGNMENSLLFLKLDISLKLSDRLGTDQLGKNYNDRTYLISNLVSC